jgi:hypothetical protein
MTKFHTGPSKKNLFFIVGVSVNKGKLYTFGDSFVEGYIHGYQGRFDGNWPLTPSRTQQMKENKLVSFTKHLSECLGLEDYNLGRAGAWNQYIIEQVANFDSCYTENDFILVVFTTPFGREHEPVRTKDFNAVGAPIEDDIDKMGDWHRYCLTKYYKQILDVKEILSGKKYLLTQGFSPIFGYVDTSSLPTHVDNFIEWGVKNNTLIDIISNTWLDETKENFLLKKKKFMLSWLNKMYKFEQDITEEENKKWRSLVGKGLIAKCNHPSPKGHELIAKTLLPYIEKLL